MSWKEKKKSVPDGTNLKTRSALKKLMNQGKFKIHDRMLGSHIGHNKFVVYVDAEGNPKSVLTGSANWTATGLCGQTNNMLFINSSDIANPYLDYWKQLENDKKQHKNLRT